MLVSILVAGLIGSNLTPKPKHAAFKLPDPLFIDFRLDDNPKDGPHQWVIVKCKYIDKGPGLGFWEECDNICQGKLHENHALCDLKCDDVCPEKIHCGCFEPEFNSRNNYAGLVAGLSAGAKQEKAPDLSDSIADHIWNDVQGPLDTSQYCIEDAWPCWNKEPCSDAYRGYETHYCTLQVTTQYSTAAANGPRIAGATNTLDLVTVEVPDLDSPIKGSYIDCLCEHKIYGMPTFWQRVNDTYHSGLQFGFGVELKPMSLMDRINYDVSIHCPDMNSCSVSARNPTPMPVDIVLYPGTQLIPSDPEFQTMMVTKPINLRVPSWGSASVTVPIDQGSEASDWQQKDPVASAGKVVCINMMKHEPTSQLQFQAVAPRSTALRLLAGTSVDERVVGPWVQTRAWIASDKAILSEVQKILNPKPTEGVYLRALYEVATRTHIDFTKEPFKRCMEPKLIAGFSAPKRATDWFVKTMAKANPKGLADWVTQNPTAFAPLFAYDAADYPRHHAADIARTFTASKSPELRKAGFAFLLNIVPESKRAELAKNGGLSGITALITSDDEASVSQALDVAEAYHDPSVLLGLENTSPKISVSLKDRAEKLAMTFK